jgi:hypothetical protein
MKIWIVALAAAAAAAALPTSHSTAYLLPSDGPAQVQILRNGPDRIGIRNQHGEWWIAKRCLGPRHWQPLRGRTTGPGYVYLVKRRGEVLVDDEGEPILDDANGGLNPYGSSGGLGSFGYHHARGTPPFEFGRRGGSNTWWVSSRVCSGDHPQTPSLFGVSERCCRVGPLRRDDRGVVHWSIDVDLRTPWQDPILRIRYEYEFAPTAVRVWTSVRSTCGNGAAPDPTCGEPAQQHFAKEPKFTVQVVPATGDSVGVYDEAGLELARWPGGHPRKGTMQSGEDSRDNVTFSASGLNVVARSFDGARMHRWEGSGHGLDAWAAEHAQAPNAKDGPAPEHYLSGHETRWGCNLGSPNGGGVRQWELVGGAPGFPLAVFFHGWEGGVGHNDCEPASRHFPPPSSVFVNYFEFTIPRLERGRSPRELAP